MYGQKETLYNVLNILRSASMSEVRNAYKRALQEQRRDSAAPDPRRQSLLHEAFEVLSDPHKRRAYDQSLGDPGFLIRPKSKALNVKLIGAGVAALAIGAGAYVYTRPEAQVQQGLKELDDAATNSTGLLQSLSVAGKTTPIGLAVTVEEGFMVTTCHGIPGGSLLVSNGPRNLTAQVVIADTELDLCRIKVESGASWPMRPAREAAKIGDRVYSLGQGANNQLQLYQGKVRSFLSTPKGQVLDVTIPITPNNSGGPLMDAKGFLLGITTAPHAYGPGLNVALPASWVGQMRGTAAAAAPTKSPAKKK